MNERYLAQDKLIYSTVRNEQKIYIREQSGFYQKIRRSLSSFLIGIFIFLPFLRHNGQQAILIDIEQQILHLFSFILYPQDLVILSLFLAFSAFALFYTTKLYGRVWCGFICPQTVWTLMFNWVERRVEGNHNQSKVLDKQPMSLNKFWRKSVKHLGWVGISILTALVFISYFVPVEQLYWSFFTLSSSALVTSWVLFFAGCTYINAGYIREKMCLHMCPYSRFQSAMFDKNTSLVTYDATRGENRGKRKRNQEKPNNMGDCIDCNLCVQVCPAGIDIREGLQYQCINCGLCVDACDQTMMKFNYPLKLIDFKKANNNKVDLTQVAGYLGMITLMLITMVYWAFSWSSFDVSIIRDRQALHRINNQGDVENTYLFKIRNKASYLENYTISVNDHDNYTFQQSPKVTVQPGELKTVTVVLAKSHSGPTGRENISFTIRADKSDHQEVKPISFYVGKGS